MGVFFGLRDRQVTTDSTVQDNNVAQQMPSQVDANQNDAAQPTPSDNPQDQFQHVSVSIDDDTYLGNIETAKVAIVEFTDYQCPYCQRHFMQTQDQIIKNFVDTGEAIYVFRDMPLPQLHSYAMRRAQAAECAKLQGGDEAFIKYHEAMFNIESPSDAADLAAIAEDLGLDGAKLLACVDNGDTLDEVQKDIMDGQAAGVQGTPGFVVGTLGKDGIVKGSLVAGAYPYSAFEEVINSYLEQE